MENITIDKFIAFIQSIFKMLCGRSFIFSYRDIVMKAGYFFAMIEIRLALICNLIPQLKSFFRNIIMILWHPQLPYELSKQITRVCRDLKVTTIF